MENVVFQSASTWLGSQLALVVAVLGMILGPIITALINNVHQSKIFGLELRTKQIEEQNSILQTASADLSSYIAYPTDTRRDALDRSFSSVYLYVDRKYWLLLDNFFSAVVENDYSKAKRLRAEVLKVLIEAQSR